MKKLAIFASGNGSNAEAIIQYFRDSPNAKVEVIATNKKDAYVLERAKIHNIQGITFSKTELETGGVGDFLLTKGIDFIILAGFLLKIPKDLVEKFPNKIVNIHPALLPKFGGKGMYGKYVHLAVKEAGELKSGITIHWVNNQYDEGKIIFQKEVEIEKSDTAEQIAEKVQALEHKYYPKIIESLI